MDAAEAVSDGIGAAGCDSLTELGALVEKGLVQVVDSGAAEARFTMLQVIREYGQERLDAAGEQSATLRRHADWCLQLAERTQPLLMGPEQAEWLARLDLEHDNIRAALAWAIEQREAELAARLGSALRRFWNLRGHSEEGRRWLERALAIGHDLPPAIRARALHAVGVVAYRQGDYARTATLDEALALYRELDDTRGVASTLGNLGLVAQALGDSRRATELIEESLDLFRALGGDPCQIANQMENLGLVAFDRGDYEGAANLLHEALATARAAGNWHSAAFSLSHLARIALAVGDADRANALQDEGLALWRMMGNRDGLAHCFENFALIAMAQAQPERAMRLVGAAEAIRSEIGAPGRLIDRQVHAQLCRDARSRMGEPVFARARRDGHAMPLEEAIRFALDHRPRSQDLGLKGAASGRT